MAIEPGTYNFTLQRRADWDTQFVFKDGDGNPINLTGYTVAAQAWDQPRTSKYADFAVTYTDRAAGKVNIALTDTQTTLFPDTAYYDIRLTNASGLSEFYVEGVITASEGYTA